MTGLDPEYRHNLTLRFSKVLLILFSIGAITRPFIPHLPPVLSWLGFLNAVLALVVYLLIRRKRFPGFEAVMVLTLSMIVITPLFLATGGVNSQYIYFLTLVPLLAALLGSVRLTWIICAVVIGEIVLMLIFAERIPDLTAYPYIAEKTRVRAVWLVFGVLFAGYMGMYFRKAYDTQSRVLDELAAIDHLTGLLNRRGLESRLHAELQRSSRSGQALSVLMIDVDFFKQFNDRHGHAAGDNCLIAVARCLEKYTRVEDIVSRYGGEEFLVVLVGIDTKDALKSAEKLRAAIAGLSPQACGASVSVTIGVASISLSANHDELTDAEELIRRADEALYRGKGAGRNRVEFGALTSTQV